jgi:hypothetical protein
MEKGLKMKGDYQAEDGQRGSSAKKALRRQLFTVGYLQFVERKHLHMQHYIQLGTELQQWQANCTVDCRRVVSQHL